MVHSSQLLPPWILCVGVVDTEQSTSYECKSRSKYVSSSRSRLSGRNSVASAFAPLPPARRLPARQMALVCVMHVCPQAMQSLSWEQGGPDKAPGDRSRSSFLCPSAVQPQVEGQQPHRKAQGPSWGGGGSGAWAGVLWREAQLPDMDKHVSHLGTAPLGTDTCIQLGLPRRMDGFHTLASWALGSRVSRLPGWELLQQPLRALMRIPQSKTPPPKSGHPGPGSLGRKWLQRVWPGGLLIHCNPHSPFPDLGSPCLQIYWKFVRDTRSRLMVSVLSNSRPFKC